MKKDDFRVKLKELLEENGILTKTQHQTQRQQPSGKINAEPPSSHNESNDDGLKSRSPVQQSLSPEEAQQIHVKPDVVLALLSVEKDPINQVDKVSYAGEDTSHVDSLTNTDSKSEQISLKWNAWIGFLGVCKWFARKRKSATGLNMF